MIGGSPAATGAPRAPGDRREDATDTHDIVIPSHLLPADGRFGSGPSKVRPEAVAALHRDASDYLGTSHRRGRVRSVVRRLREGLARLFDLPDGYEVVLGNGGAAFFWDALVLGLVERRSQHLVFGEFSSKLARAAEVAPHLHEPDVIASEPGTHPVARPSPGVDLYALTHNETSTGVAMPVARVPGGLTTVDATSAAGGLRVDARAFDVYYFAPQKCFASDGGLWIALVSPAAIERIERIRASGRHIPSCLDLSLALQSSRRDETFNTPALATLFLMLEQLEWMLANGGLEWAARRCERSAGILYGWAEAHPLARPFVADPAARSPVVATVDFDAGVDAAAVARVLRDNGVVDTEPYRKLHRNQLRVGLYPAIEPEDVAALTRSIDYTIDALEG
jgi:phosphoserine aminotransferase